jgi:hypothetical protein
MSEQEITRKQSDKSASTGATGRAGDRVARAEPLHELTLGRLPSRPPSVDIPAGLLPANSGLDDLAASCRRKAGAARGVASRLRARSIQAEDALDADEAAWADRLSDAALFQKGLSEGASADLAAVEALADAFETLAAAIELVDEAGPGTRRRRLEQALPLMAEAQSAVRAAAKALNLGEEPEQARAFDWLKTTAARQRVYLHRFMRVDDPADPARSSALLAQILAASSRERAPRPGAGLDSARARADRISAGLGGDEDWRILAQAVDRIVSDGVPPSHRDLRDLLLPLADDLPDRDDLPSGFRLALREVDRYLSTRPAAGSAGDRAPTPEVTAARRLLAGKSAVLIGGARRRDAERELKDALGLAELFWVETKEHQSVLTFAPAVSRPEVAVVLLAIRWSSHGFGDVKQFCDKHHKPLVRLPGGYSPNQVAAQVVAQCAARLGGE